MQKEGRALIYSQIAVNDGKGQRLPSKDSHDTEAVLAHYRVDKLSKRFYQL